MEAFNTFSNLFIDVWKEGIFGINASEIIIGLLIFLFFYVLRRLFARFLINRINKIVNKTSNTIDNTVVEVIEGPLKFLPVVLGFFIASSYIDFSIEIKGFIHHIKDMHMKKNVSVLNIEKITFQETQFPQVTLNLTKRKFLCLA